jgi:hypothetical protein
MKTSGTEDPDMNPHSYTHWIFVIFLFIYSHVRTLLGHFSSASLPHPSPLPPISFKQVSFCPYHWFCWSKNICMIRKSAFASWVKDSYKERSLLLLSCTHVLRPMLVQLWLIFTLVPDPLLMITCPFKVSVLVPLEWDIKRFHVLGLLLIPISLICALPFSCNPNPTTLLHFP